MTRGRKKIPNWVKRLVLKRQDNVCICGCGEKVELRATQFDHDPPVALRERNKSTGDTIPPQNDPDYIFARVPRHHFTKTYCPRGPHTSLDSDRHSIDKAKRIANGGRKRKGLPFPGSINSPWKKPFNGIVEFRKSKGERHGVPANAG